MDNSLFNTVLASVKERMPGISWRVGSLVRELLVQPLVHIGEIIDDYVNKREKLADIFAALDNPDENEDVLDYWITELGLTKDTNSTSETSSGLVGLIIKGYDKVEIPANSVFSWGDNLLLRSSSFVEIDPRTPSTYKAQLVNGVVVADIPVVVDDSTIGLVGVGTKLNWSEAPDSVIDIYVSSPIQATTSALSAQAKATLIRSLLTTPSMCGEDTILSGLVRKFGTAICDVKLKKATSNTGRAGTDIWVKQSTSPVVDHISLKVYDSSIINIQDPTIIAVNSVTDSNKRNLAFQASFSDAGLTIATGDKINGSVYVEAVRYTNSKEAIDWLNRTQIGGGALFVAKAPAYCELELNIPCGGALSAEVLAAISTRINDSQLSPCITDRNISSILADRGLTLNQPIIYTATVYYNGNINVYTQVGSINFSGLSRINDTPVAVYCPTNKITTI